MQGPDIFKAFLDCFKNKSISDLNFSVHSYILCDHCLLIDIVEKPIEDYLLKAPAKCVLTVDDRIHNLFIQEVKQSSSASNRIAYNESLVTSQCQIMDQNIVLNGKSPLSFIETIVSMKKKLLIHLYPNVRGKWVFTKIEMDTYLEDRTDLCIHIVRNLNFKIIKSTIIHQDCSIGNLYFSLVQ